MLISLRVRQELRPFGTPPPAGLDPLSHSTRSSGHCLPDAVSWSPNNAFWIGSKKGITPSSARRSRTSPIRGMRLQRLLGTRLAISCLPDWRSGAAFRPVCFAAWRSARYGLSCCHPASDRPPGLRYASALAMAFPRGCIAAFGESASSVHRNINTCGFATPHHTANARISPVLGYTWFSILRRTG
jgi:hypothetical protein